MEVERIPNSQMLRGNDPTNFIVLAGGEGKRVEKEKAFLEVAGRKILDRILNQLNSIQGQGEKVVIITGEAGLFQCCNKVEIRKDIIPGRGPLGGIYSGLLFSQTRYNLVLACDMPFLNAELLEFMLGIKRDYQVLIPRHSGQIEPLVAIYSRDILPIVRESLERENPSIRNMFSRLEVRYLERREIVRFGQPENSWPALSVPILLFTLT